MILKQSKERASKHIYNKLNLTKYKVTKTDAEYDRQVKEKIQVCVDHEIPIHILLPFGGIKNIYIKTYPHIDYGEVFNIAFIRDYLKPIAKGYKHGVILEYHSVEIIEEALNNIPKKDTEVYDIEFGRLITMYQSYLPPNMTLKYTKAGDHLNRAVVNKNMTNKIRELKKEWNKQPQNVIDEKIKRAKRNCFIPQNTKDLDDVILTSALAHDAFSSECWLPYTMPWGYKEIITIGHNYTTGWGIRVKSTPASTINFWSGIGVIIQQNDKYIPTILSAEQYKAVKAIMKETRVTIFENVSQTLNMLPVISK